MLTTRRGAKESAGNKTQDKAYGTRRLSVNGPFGRNFRSAAEAFCLRSRTAVLNKNTVLAHFVGARSGNRNCSPPIGGSVKTLCGGCGSAVKPEKIQIFKGVRGFAQSCITAFAVFYRKGGCKMKNRNIVELRDVTLSFDGEKILDRLDLTVRDGEFVTFLGRSGCGKTTTLRIIAGFLTPDEGDVFFDGVRINDVPPYRRSVNTIFQRYALFPHLNVYENVAFGLRVSKTPREEIDPKVREMLRLVNLEGYEKRKVTNLSGGQQQRVAIARALVNRPKVLLLDEPLSALDAKLRKDMQVELRRIQRETGITFIFVTHDQEEALSMSDTVVVMENGKIQQIGAPVDIYNEPKNAFVADFIGESNIIDGVMNRDDTVTFAGHTFTCVDEGFEKDEPVDVVIRPEDVDIVPANEGMVKGKITQATFKGDYYELIVDVKGFKWMVQTTDAYRENQVIGIALDPDSIHVMHKSEFSGLYGDYSTFSDDFDEDPEADDE